VDRETLLRLFRYARDHLKIFRNCVQDIDSEGSSRDREQQPHSIDLLREKWNEATVRETTGRNARIDFDCDYSGDICESCMETSALDRIVYNLVMNAAKYGTDDWIRFRILSMPPQAEEPETLRFIMVNPVEADHRTRLREFIGADTNAVFEARTTTRGNGYGLHIVVEFVTAAFGLHSEREALDSGYVGARLENNHFIVWFHWPTVA